MALKAIALLLSCVFLAQTQAQSTRSTINEQVITLVSRCAEGLETIANVSSMYYRNTTYQGSKLSGWHDHLVMSWWDYLLYFVGFSVRDVATMRNISTLSCKKTFGLEVQRNRLDADTSECLANNTQLKNAADSVASYKITGNQLQTLANKTKDVKQLVFIATQQIDLLRQAFYAFGQMLNAVTNYSDTLGACLIRGDERIWKEVYDRLAERHRCLLSLLLRSSNATRGAENPC